MTKAWKVVAVLAIAVLVPGGTYLSVGLYMLMQVAYEMAGAKITGFDGRNLKMDIAIRLKNPSDLSITVTQYKLNFYFNDTPVSVAESDAPKEIVGKAAQVLTTPLSIDLKSLLKDVDYKKIIIDFASKRYDDITVKVDGYFKVKLLKIPYTYKLKKADWTWTLTDILAMYNTPSAPTKTQ